MWFYLGFAVPVIVLLAMIAIPNLVKARKAECKNACVNNLRQLDGAKESWSLEHKKADNWIVSAADEKEILKYVKGGQMPTCPDGGTLQINNVGAVPTCTIPGHSL